MKLTKTLCLVAATAAIALAPINTSTGQTNTVLAMQGAKQRIDETKCTLLGHGHIQCPDGIHYHEKYDPYSLYSWVSRSFRAFTSVWRIVDGLFK
ncbi:TPA: hypothetical protein TUM56_001940 [Streptococcus equi subsp. zooepidemicus]|uniref:hypothetical protein n=1 Tax=Streptococcus equi TaxID=1336 RepID=UPI00197D3300|nr:hypothetical protein [Streptococcus equi]QTZ57621.1 hypothetical protein JFMEOBDD_01706 [Streptococcus equi subsp. zooepidemicus]UFR19359.1 hypothetical protein KV238_05090 [Streptococcus equi subsp. zooepidemicus]HEL0008594.1 hypothetical protein [Streptococcus equi subsp. zooepidemicus]HEL0115728.1 hypothetical protein [Streptococcus equi subsp. zooepidemicus]HEL0117766.1 hypothetical protein [Streptococcus equi subsp. zooepidemicus]